MLKIHKLHSKKLSIMSITSILSICTLLGISYLTYTPNLSHADSTDTGNLRDKRTLNDITYMQEMTGTICANSGYTSKQLIDSRDGTTYLVAKIKNTGIEESRCWMIENMRLVGPRTLTSAGSDVIQDYYLPASVTFDTANGSPVYFVSDYDGSYESDQYESRVYYADNTSYGAYYNWYTATAGTGNDYFSGWNQKENAPSSICPKGWKLPTGGGNGDFYQLMNGLTYEAIMQYPYYFTQNGLARNNEILAGNGHYWSSTHYASFLIYTLTFDNRITTGGYTGRSDGIGIRCISLPEDKNIEITVKPQISLDTSSVLIEGNATAVNTSQLVVNMKSNQIYMLKIGTDSGKSSLVSDGSITIPASSNVTAGVNGWGIKKKKSATTSALGDDTNVETYSAVSDTTPENFYRSASAEVRELLFDVGISTSPDIPNGEYSTDITITATQN